MRNAPNPVDAAEVIIIGAGPAGLACAAALGDLGLSSTLLESGSGPGDSWRRMPDNLKLGPWVSTQLDKSIPLAKLYLPPSAKDFAKYLAHYASSNQLDVRPQQNVQAVRKKGDGFVIETTASQPFEASCVVNATGYYRNPVIPDWAPKLPASCKLLHYSDYRNPSSLSRTGESLRILIVGGRISAGELLIDLEKSPHELTLSTRHAIRFERPKWLQLLAAPLYFRWEERMARSPTKGSSTRNMEGGKTARMIRSGRVRTIGPILEARDNRLVHSSGSDEFDVVLLATGWKGALSHLPEELLDSNGEPLASNMQSKVWPGLFFLGFDNLRSFRSRFLRGIREDATHLALSIQRHLAS